MNGERRANMKHMITSLIASSALAGLGAAAAYADPPHCPPGHEMQGRCSNDANAQRAYEQGYDDGQRDAIRYGDRRYTDYRVIRDHNRYGLITPPDGYYYARMDDDIVLVLAATQIIQEFIR